MWLGLYQSASIWLCVGPTSAPQLDCAAGADWRPAHQHQNRHGDGKHEHRVRSGVGRERRPAWPRAKRHRGACQAPLLSHHSAMLRLFGPDCPPKPIDAVKLEAMPDGAIWVDLLEPTKEEEAFAEKLIGTNIPTREEMLEIEPSSRLYEKDGVVFMTMSVIFGINDGRPGTDPISFILTDNHLVTVRYIDPKPFIAFAEQLTPSEPGQDALTS